MKKTFKKVMASVMAITSLTMGITGINASAETGYGTLTQGTSCLMVASGVVYASTSSSSSSGGYLKVSITSTTPSETSYPSASADPATIVYVRVYGDKTKASSSHTAGSTGSLTVYR